MASLSNRARTAIAQELADTTKAAEAGLATMDAHVPQYPGHQANTFEYVYNEGRRAGIEAAILAMSVRSDGSADYSLLSAIKAHATRLKETPTHE